MRFLACVLLAAAVSGGAIAAPTRLVTRPLTPIRPMTVRAPRAPAFHPATAIHRVPAARLLPPVHVRRLPTLHAPAPRSRIRPLVVRRSAKALPAPRRLRIRRIVPRRTAVPRPVTALVPIEVGRTYRFTLTNNRTLVGTTQAVTGSTVTVVTTDGKARGISRSAIVAVVLLSG